MPLKIHHSTQAARDLRGIWNYIAADNEKAADAVLRKIMQVLNRLSSHPETGRARPELGAVLRSVPVGRYLLFYRTDDETLHLVRVVSAYLDLSQVDLGEDHPPSSK